LHLGRFTVLASLVGAISNTIGEPRVVAVAANVARLASELALGNTNHVCYARLAALREIRQGLGHTNGGSDGEESD